MKICVIGAPSTGKSVFARSLSAELVKRGHSCELVQEYATYYIQHVGAPEHAWEQVVISVGQHLAEQEAKRDHVVTDAAGFATYIYAQRQLPEQITSADWPKYRHMLDMLRQLARLSALSYDLIFLLTHVFPPKPDKVRLAAHLTLEECLEINRDFESYLRSERLSYVPIDASSPHSLTEALAVIAKHLPIAAQPTHS